MNTLLKTVAGRRLRHANAPTFYRRHLRPGDLAFDVGANLGEHTKAMLAAAALVLAIEPQQDLAARLEAGCPEAQVLAVAVGDHCGEATLLTSTQHTLATLNPDWPSQYQHKVRDAGWAPADWNAPETVPVVTLDRLIAEHGHPAFVKIDVEGLEDKVLAGLSRPVKKLLFEVQSGLPDVAAGAFRELERLGRYEYRMMEYGCWQFRRPMTAREILSQLPDQGDVFARRI